MPTLYSLAILVGVCGLYYVLGRLALMLLSESEGVAVFWPASGLAAGAIVVLPRGARLPIVLAVALATVLANLEARSSIEATIAFALCNAAECLIFGEVVRLVDKSHPRLESLGSVAAFLLAAVLATAIAALPAALTVQHLGLSDAGLLLIWLRWLESDLLGILALAPVLITWRNLSRSSPRVAVLVESMIATSLTPVATYLAFSLVYASAIPALSPRFVLLPLFIWLAARTPAFFPALSAFLMSVVVVLVALSEVPSLEQDAAVIAERLVGAKVAIVSGTLVLLVLSAMFARLNNQAAELRSSRNRLRLALEAGRMYAFEYDHNRGEVYREGGLIERLGLSPRGSVGEFIATLVPDERRSFQAMLEALSPAGPQAELVMRMKASDGKMLSVEYRSEAEFDNNGRLLRMYGTFVDVTEREAQAETLRAALNAGRAYAFDHDKLKNVVRRTGDSSEILGVDVAPDRPGAGRFLDHVHPEDRAAFIAHVGRDANVAAVSSLTFRFCKPDGSIAWLEARSKVVVDEAGRPIGIRGLVRDVTDKTRADQRQELLVRELDHRVKNALARMAVVIELSRDGHQTLEEYVEVIQGRIASMARTQERLSGNRWNGVGVAALIADELAAYRRGGNCRIDGPDEALEPDTAQAFAFTMHELSTNAAKYGGLSTPAGRVDVTWSVEPAGDAARVLRLVWRETGVDRVQPPTRESYGLRTIRNLLRYEHDASVELDFTPTGLVCTIGLPLPTSALRGEIAAAGIIDPDRVPAVPATR